MKHSLQFYRASVSGDSHSVEVVFNTREDALKAMEYLKEKDDSCHDFSIYPFLFPHPVSFEEWVEKYG